MTHRTVTRTEEPDGYGCRPTLVAFGLLAAFVVVAATAGVSLALRSTCTGACETIGFTLYGAGLPISGTFAAFAGDLPIAWPLDTTFWVIVSLLAGRWAERRSIPVWAAVARVVALALALGFGLSFLIETV